MLLVHLGSVEGLHSSVQAGTPLVAGFIYSPFIINLMNPIASRSYVFSEVTVNLISGLRSISPFNPKAHIWSPHVTANWWITLG